MAVWHCLELLHLSTPDVFFASDALRLASSVFVRTESRHVLKPRRNPAWTACPLM